MGILTNALDQIVGQLIGTGFNQLDEYFTRKAESGQMEEAAREAAEIDNQLNQRFLMMENVNQGSFGIPGIGDTTGQMVDPMSPQGRGILSKLGTLPEIPAAIGQSPLHASLVEHRGKQFIDQNPIVQQMKQREDIFSEALKRGGQLVGDKTLEPGQMEAFARDPSQFSLEGIRGNLGLREEAISRGKLNVSGPEFDRQQAIRTADRIRAKQSPSYKQLQGGGGDKPKKPKELSKSNLQNIRFLIHDAKPDLYGEDFNEKGDIVPVPTADTRWIETRAKHYMSKEHLGEVSAVERAVQDFEERQNSPEVQKQKQQQRRIQAPNASRFLENAATSTPAIPETPAAPERAKEVQTGRDPATENKIKAAKSLGATDAEIKQSLIDEGKNPADYGYR